MFCSLTACSITLWLQSGVQDLKCQKVASNMSLVVLWNFFHDQLLACQFFRKERFGFNSLWSNKDKLFVSLLLCRKQNKTLDWVLPPNSIPRPLRSWYIKLCNSLTWIWCHRAPIFKCIGCIIFQIEGISSGSLLFYCSQLCFSIVLYCLPLFSIVYHCSLSFPIVLQQPSHPFLHYLFTHTCLVHHGSLTQSPIFY